jgi:hypothetical protein
MPADPIAAAVAYLKADGSVGSRVFGGELPGREAKSMPRQAVVVKPAGGGLLGRNGQAYRDQRIDVDCYGETPLEAWGLHLLVEAALSRLSRSVQAGVLLASARSSTRGTLARDPDTDWPVAVSTYQLTLGESTP